MAAPPRSVPWVIDEFMASRDMVECHNSCPITFTDCRPYRVLSGSAACSLACFSNWMKAHWANGWVNVIGNSGNRSLTASASLFFGAASTCSISARMGLCFRCPGTWFLISLRFRSVPFAASALFSQNWHVLAIYGSRMANSDSPIVTLEEWNGDGDVLRPEMLMARGWELPQEMRSVCA